MVAFVIRRILFSFVVLLFASMAIFFLVRFAGDPLVQLRQNPQVSGDDLQRIADSYGLNEPIFQQYLIWLAGMFQGDFGLSFQQNAPVGEIIGRRIVPTVLLIGSSLLLTIFIAIPLGVFQAIKKYTRWDNALTFLAFLGFSTPVFFLGLMMQLVFAVQLADLLGTKVFYTTGMNEPGGGFIDLLQHLTLPALALSVITIASFSRFQRSAMMEALASDYLRTARAKGLSNRAVYLKHALRNALIPVITLLAISLGTVLAGATVTEIVFAWPGLGSLLYDSLLKGDYNVARGLLMILAAFTIVANLLADLVYAVVDPRIRYD